MFDLNEFCKKSFEVAKARQDNGGKINVDPFQMLKHCATEVVEATESFVAYRQIKNLAEDLTATDIEEKWESQEEPDVCEEYYQKSRNSFISELADIISCCVIIAGKEGFDLEQALNDCYERNKLRSENKGDKK